MVGDISWSSLVVQFFLAKAVQHVNIIPANFEITYEQRSKAFKKALTLLFTVSITFTCCAVALSIVAMPSLSLSLLFSPS